MVQKRRTAPRKPQTPPVKKTKKAAKVTNSNRKSSKTQSQSSDSIRVSKLLPIGPLLSGHVLNRPSATIRSPYVADVKLDSTGETICAHSPALDVGGLCSPGAKVWMSIRPTGGKTSHAIELVVCEGPECGDSNEALVGAHPRLAELVTKKLLETSLLPFGGRDAETTKGQVSNFSEGRERREHNAQLCNQQPFSRCFAPHRRSL